MRVFYPHFICISLLFFMGCGSVSAIGDEQSKVNELIQLSTAYRFSDINKSITTIDAALLAAQKIDYKQGVAECYLKKGQYLSNNGNPKESAESLDIASGLFKKIGNKGKYALCLKELADYYLATGDMDKAKGLIKQSSDIAIEMQNNELHAECEIASGILDMNTGKLADATAHYLNALKTAEMIKNDELVMNSCRELGNINSLAGNITVSNEYFQRALSINIKMGNKLGVADAYCNIGSNFLMLGNMKEAMANIQNSLTLSRELNYKPTIALDLVNLGYCLINKNQNTDAKNKLDEADSIFDLLNDKHGKAEALNVRGYMAAKMKDYDEAAKSYLASLDLSTPINAKDQMKASYDGLAYIFEQRKDYEGAYKFEKLSQGIGSQLFGSSNGQAVARLQLNYDFERAKEQQTVEQELKDEIVQSERIKDRYFRYFLIVLGLMVCGIAISTFTAYRANRHAKELLFEKNILITKEKEAAERILSDIIPVEIESRIKASGIGEIENFATVMFVDFDEFTKTEQQFNPMELMDELDIIFKGMDDISKKYKLETLRTLSDGYLCIGGLANSLDCRPTDVIEAAIKIQIFMESLKLRNIKDGKSYFQMRIGVHTGQIAGGIVGVRTIAADIWGETVQVASMIEKMAQAGEIRISEATFQLVRTKFETVYSGKLKISSKNVMVYQIANFKAEFGKLSVSDSVSELLDKLGS